MEWTKGPLVCEIVGGEPYEYYPLGEHIVAAPGVCGGRPTFKYTRIDARHAIGLIAGGRSVQEVAAVLEALDLAVQALSTPVA